MPARIELDGWSDIGQVERVDTFDGGELIAEGVREGLKVFRWDGESQRLP
jgi:hypothetical protein